MRDIAKMVSLFVLATGIVHSAPTGHLDFSVGDTVRVVWDGYDVVQLKGSDLCDRSVGAPYLPRKTVRILIPLNMRASGITILASESQELDDTFYIYPTQPPWLTDGSPRPP
jgi:hypothetical protein